MEAATVVFSTSSRRALADEMIVREATDPNAGRASRRKPVTVRRSRS